MKKITISKSRYMRALNCDKALYMDCHHRDLRESASGARQAIMGQGTDVGVFARKYFSRGVLVDALYYETDKALEQTEEAMANNAEAIFEAAFRHENMAVRVDILYRPDPDTDEYELIEVKSSSGIKEDYYYDLSYQFYVLKASGINLQRASIMYINNQYMYDGGEHNLENLFTVADVTESISLMQEDIPEIMLRVNSVVSSDEIPDIETGRHCRKPFKCAFYSHCHEGQSEYPVYELPGIREPLEEKLRESGYEDIRDVPDDFPGFKSEYQKIKEVLIQEKPYFSEVIKQELDQLEYPVHFIDFETVAFPIPFYQHTRAYESIPFQWSAHIIDESGGEYHQEFLYESSDDPRMAFTESLIRALGEKGSILVYTSYEQTVLNKLAEQFPPMKPALNKLVARFVDLAKVVKGNCYHEGFRGSYSIKKVLPALVPELSYADLEIGEGAHASMAFAEIVKSETKAERREELRTALLTYCKRDTEAMVEIYKKLKEFTV